MMDPNAPASQPVPPQTPYVPPAAPPPPKKSGMGAGLILALGCFGFLALCFVGIVVLAAIGGEGGSGSVENKSVLRMKLSGGTPEYVRSSGLEEIMGGAPVTVRQHVFNLE